MLVFPGRLGNVCDGPTRREFLRVGSVGLFGLGLTHFLAMEKIQAASKADLAAKYRGVKGFGSARHVILLFLQGGPSHLDIWDPKPEAASNIKGEFNPSNLK